MSVVNAVCTDLFITMRKADLEFQLLEITNTLSKLAQESGNQATELMEKFSKQLAYNQADEPAVTVDVMTNADYNIQYNTMMLLFHAKEQKLETRKKQIETELQAITTEKDGIQSMIDKSIQKEYGIFKN